MTTWLKLGHHYCRLFWSCLSSLLAFFTSLFVSTTSVGLLLGIGIVVNLWVWISLGLIWNFEIWAQEIVALVVVLNKVCGRWVFLYKLILDMVSEIVLNETKQFAAQDIFSSFVGKSEMVQFVKWGLTEELYCIHTGYYRLLLQNVGSNLL